MSLYNGPVRAGARGGRGEFSWDTVKNDKDREYYLGHSVKALAGRWQKNKDVYWYTRDKGQEDKLVDEVKAVKQREEELMMEALGLKPKSAPVVHQPMDAKELAMILKKNQQAQEDDQEGGQQAVGKEDAGAMKGLGFAGASGGLPRAASGGHAMELGGRLQGEGLTEDGAAPGTNAALPGKAAMGAGVGGKGLPGPPPLPPPPSSSGGNMLLGMLASGMRLTSQQLKELAKHDKKAAKRAKKEAKKAKKEAKKSKKEKKDRKRSPEGDDVDGSRKRARHDTDDEREGGDKRQGGGARRGDGGGREPTGREQQGRERDGHDAGCGRGDVRVRERDGVPGDRERYVDAGRAPQRESGRRSVSPLRHERHQLGGHRRSRSPPRGHYGGGGGGRGGGGRGESPVRHQRPLAGQGGLRRGASSPRRHDSPDNRPITRRHDSPDNRPITRRHDSRERLTGGPDRSHDRPRVKGVQGSGVRRREDEEKGQGQGRGGRRSSPAAEKSHRRRHDTSSSSGGSSSDSDGSSSDSSRGYGPPRRRR